MTIIIVSKIENDGPSYEMSYKGYLEGKLIKVIIFRSEKIQFKCGDCVIILAKVVNYFDGRLTVSVLKMKHIF